MTLTPEQRSRKALLLELLLAIYYGGGGFGLATLNSAVIPLNRDWHNRYNLPLLQQERLLVETATPDDRNARESVYLLTPLAISILSDRKAWIMTGVTKNVFAGN